MVPGTRYPNYTWSQSGFDEGRLDYEPDGREFEFLRARRNALPMRSGTVPILVDFPTMYLGILNVSSDLCSYEVHFSCLWL